MTSKAQEWAEFMEAVKSPPQYRTQTKAKGRAAGNVEWFACVNDDGDLSLRGVLGASQALELRDWLTDTFEDRPRLEGEK